MMLWGALAFAAGGYGLVRFRDWLRTGLKPLDEALSDHTDTDDIRCRDALRALYGLPAIGCERGAGDVPFAAHHDGGNTK